MTVLLKLDFQDPKARKMEADRLPAWAVFNAAWYKTRYPDALAQMREIGLTDPEVFYHNYGARLGHSPNMYFDEVYYLRTYRDVATHGRRGTFRSGFDHYRQHGYRKLSPHWLFSGDFYRKANPDVTPSLLASLELANSYDHYISFGDRDYRSGHWLFDATLYRDNKPEQDRSDRGVGGSFAQFLAGGCQAGSHAMLSWYFDPVWYLKAHPQAEAAIAARHYSCALEHFLCNPTPQHFQPHEWFSGNFYGETYPDMRAAAAEGNFRGLYEHFVRHGAVERRNPHPELDLKLYAQTPSAQGDLALGLFRDPFAHFVARGGLAAPALPPEPVDEDQTKQIFLRAAAAMMPQLARNPLDFSLPDGAPPAFSVIMVLHNQFTLTMAALASLRGNFPGPVELILVDSGSRDDTRGIEDAIIGAKLIRFRYNAGFVEACNAAIPHVTAPAVLFLNNDLMLAPNACRQALARLLSDPGIGAVGGKIIRTNGLLQEAGCLVWRNGYGVGYLRNEDPNLPEANFVRDVDYCSGAFLMMRTDAVRQLGGFDDDYRPAYYEDADLCLRLRKAGYRVLYDPAVMIQHLEFGSGSTAGSMQMMRRNHKIFVTKHQDYLRYQHPPQPRNLARARLARPPLTDQGQAAVRPLRILFVEDRVPLRKLGSGYVRSNDIVTVMAAAGHTVSVYPMVKRHDGLIDLYRDMPDNVEVLHDRALADFGKFIKDRPSYYDIVWIGRTHNLNQLLPALIDVADCLPDQGFVLDTEAVAASRTAAQDRVLGRAPAERFERALESELACAYYCQAIVAVNEADAQLVRQAGFRNVSVLGHRAQPRPTASSWAQRRDLLFLGAIHQKDAPNYDSVAWFLAEILPLLTDRLLPDLRITIAGYLREGLDLSAFAEHPNVDLIGPINDLAPLYDRHRVFVAPTRFAGGIPYKVHEAAAHGLPVVATDLLCRQLGWTDRVEIMNGGDSDAARFAQAVAALYQDAGLWQTVRAGASLRLQQDCDAEAYAAQIDAILRSVLP
ncbi:glycosyltransferase [Acidisoma cellulosilytica]|uniref:Glycosyltransferase n=1 Tax=Acidisoma cellulosilyticum TaxID=2802395 RepID=A0A964E5N0_9PROT|nr:glycosyltransferase [Acidisoma cellulosilyticum]MCB8882689.1 glycosyltransferase [Acidisoma cellulosilyticum]